MKLPHLRAGLIGLAAIAVGAVLASALPAGAAVSVHLPQEALLYVYGVYKVFVIEGGSLKEKEVKLGERQGDEVEIIEGLAAGEQVALPVKGQELKGGSPVEIVK